MIDHLEREHEWVSQLAKEASEDTQSDQFAVLQTLMSELAQQRSVLLAKHGTRIAKPAGTHVSYFP